MASINFNANEVPEQDDKFELIPAGDYKAIVTESEIKTTKAGTGKYVSLKVQLVEKNRIVFANINHDNPNPTAKSIGQRELADLTKAVGLVTLTDTAQLHNKPIMVRIGIEPAKDGYEASNRVKKWMPISDASTAEVITMPTAKPTGAKPWEL